MKLQQKGLYNFHAIFVSETYRLIYFGIAKSGSTSFRSAKHLKFGERKFLNEIRNYENYENYVKFTTFRENVVDRFVSAYIEDVTRAKEDMKHLQENKFYTITDPATRFLSYLEEQENMWFFSHAMHQVDFISDFDLNPIKMDFYIQLENVDDDFQDMMHDLNLNLSTPKQVYITNPEAKQEIYSYFDETTEKRIKNLYQSDTEYFRREKHAGI